MVLEEYKEIVGTSASLCTMGQMFAGTFICRDIYRKGTSKGFDPMPFVGGLGMGILMFRYAWILKDPAMITVNIFGLLINVAYTAVFYYYSPDTKSLHSLMAKVGAFAMFFLAYAELENPENLEFRFGLIITSILFLLIASPFLHLKEIIRTKNTDILPFPLILMGTVVATQWLLYGIIIENPMIINIVGLSMSIGQLSLFVIYPSKSTPAKASSKKAD